MLPASGAAVTAEFSAAAQGTGLPSGITFSWSVQKGGVATGDATVSATGGFSSAVVGVYTVKATAEVNGETKSGEATFTVKAYVLFPETLAEAITHVEDAVKTAESVKKSIVVAYALREAKKTSAGAAQLEALKDAYLQASAGYEGADFSVVNSPGVYWAYAYVISQWSWARYPISVAFSNVSGKIVDIVFALPDTPNWQNNSNNNTGVTQDGSGEYYRNWTTPTLPNSQSPNTYLDIMHHFVGMDAKAASAITRGPNTTGVIYQGAPVMRTGATETARNVAAGIVDCADRFIKSPEGQKFA